MSNYKQVVFVCDFDGKVVNYCDKDISFVIGENIFLYFKDKIFLNFGEVHFNPDLMYLTIEGTDIRFQNNCVFWLNEKQFGFGYIIYSDPSIEEGYDFLKEENKIYNLVRNYFNKKYNNSLPKNISFLDISVNEQEAHLLESEEIIKKISFIKKIMKECFDNLLNCFPD